MKKLTFALAAGMAVLVTGCLVTSVCPYYTQKDLAFEPALLGNWTNSQDSDEHWKFEKEGTNSYRLTYATKDESSAMQARLFKLRGEAFLDLFTTEMKDQETQPPPIPSHFLFRVFEIKSEVRMAALNYEWLRELLAKEPQTLRHHLLPVEESPDKQRLVLTAETQELQKFIIKHLKTEEAWKNDFRLKRDSATVKNDPQPGR
jgi:hypothetical protein